MQSEEVVIVPYRDGPYLVRGPMVLRDQEGEAIELSRRTVALCRCGKSRIRPFCDGTHRTIRFNAPSQLERPHTDPGDDEQRRPPTPRKGPAVTIDRSACLDLIRGALAALAPLSDRTGATSDAIAQLSAAAALLDPHGDQSCRS